MNNVAPDIETLIRRLTTHFNAHQHSERWAMYRIITPVIDFACIGTSLHSRFEFNQTSAHGNSQSVDIALLEGKTPRVLVEAKRIGRSISYEQIEKYLELGVIGIVSNGIDWIFCQDGTAFYNQLWDKKTGEISVECVRRIVQFVATHVASGEEIQTHANKRSIPRPTKPAKPNVAKRKVNDVSKITSAKELNSFAEKLMNGTEADKAFLTGFAEKFISKPEHIEVEARATRMSVWSLLSGSKKRQMRIEFGKGKPSTLVRTSIVDGDMALREDFNHERHDKHGDMREYRPSSVDVAAELGRHIGAHFYY